MPAHLQSGNPIRCRKWPSLRTNDGIHAWEKPQKTRGFLRSRGFVARFKSGFFLAGDDRVNNPGERGADDGGEPEEPELLDGPAADEERGSGAAGGVHREIGDRDADEVDQREPEADGDRREACGARLSVAPRMIMRKKKVSTISATRAATIE